MGRGKRRRNRPPAWTAPAKKFPLLLLLLLARSRRAASERCFSSSDLRRRRRQRPRLLRSTGSAARQPLGKQRRDPWEEEREKKRVEDIYFLADTMAGREGRNVGERRLTLSFLV